MFFQFNTTKTASKNRLVRPGPVTKLVMMAFQSMCATDMPATAAPPTPKGSKTPSAFADAILLAPFRALELYFEDSPRFAIRFGRRSRRTRRFRAQDKSGDASTRKAQK